MARKKTKAHIGTDFEDYLREQGQLEASTARAVKRVLAWQLAEAMKRGKVTKAELARRMKTSRAVVHRLLDESDSSVTLATISKAAIPPASFPTASSFCAARSWRSTSRFSSARRLSSVTSTKERRACTPPFV